MTSVSAKARGSRQLSDELVEFFDNRYNIVSMLKVLRKERKDGTVSLRLLDYFVVNYAEEYSVAFPHPQTNTLFEVYKSYESCMKTYHKAFFDPFRRGREEDRLDFEFSLDSLGSVDSVDSVDTTLAQLNFFRWIIENGILNYVEENQEAISVAMREHLKRPRDANGSTTLVVPSGDQSTTTTVVTNGTTLTTQTSMMEISLGMVPRRRRSKRGAKESDRIPARRTPLNGKRSYTITV